MLQLGQQTELRWNVSTKLLAWPKESLQLDQLAYLRGNRTCEDVYIETQPSQLSQLAQLRNGSVRHCRRDLAVPWSINQSRTAAYHQRIRNNDNF